MIVKDKNTGRYIVVDHKSKSKFKNEEERDVYNENIDKINILIQKKVIQHKEYIHTNALYYKTEFLNTKYTLYDLDILSLD